MNKRIKLALIVAPIAAIAVGGAVYALPDKKQPTQLSTQPVSTVQTEATSTTDTQPVATEAQTTSTSADPVPTPAPTPTPDWGEDPNTPGMYRVFNTTKVMDEANIPAADREYVNKIARAWYYKGNDNAALCGVYPRSRMSTAGADYDTNPVTQLKWCDAYVRHSLGSWATAYQRFLDHQF